MLKSADAADFVQYLYQLAVKAQETRDNTGIQNIRNRWTQVVMVAKDKVGRVLDRNTRAEVNEVASPGQIYSPSTDKKHSSALTQVNWSKSSVYVFAALTNRSYRSQTGLRSSTQFGATLIWS